MNAVPTLQTARCNLALLQPDNAHLFFAYRERNLAHVAPWEPAPNPKDGTLEQACHRVGIGGVVQAGFHRGIFQACHLGYSVDHDWQGKGLMFEVAQAGIAYMFDIQGLHRIMANHMPANVRSEKLLRRLGFEREGFARAYLKINGQWQDHVLNALVNEPP